MNDDDDMDQLGEWDRGGVTIVCIAGVLAVAVLGFAIAMLFV